MDTDPGLAEAVEQLIANNQRDADEKAVALAAAADNRAAQGLTRSAELMRVRRARKDIRDAERASQAAMAAAHRLLADHHPEEFTVLLQIERQKRGLGLYKPRKDRNGPSGPKTAPQVAVSGSASPEPVPTPPMPSKEALRAEKAPAAVLAPHTPSQQAKCPHNGGLRKFTYGTFCVLCGKDIRRNT